MSCHIGEVTSQISVSAASAAMTAPHAFSFLNEARKCSNSWYCEEYTVANEVGRASHFQSQDHWPSCLNWQVESENIWPHCYIFNAVCCDRFHLYQKIAAPAIWTLHTAILRSHNISMKFGPGLNTGHSVPTETNNLKDFIFRQLHSRAWVCKLSSETNI